MGLEHDPDDVAARAVKARLALALVAAYLAGAAAMFFTLTHWHWYD